jgi:hypothetical protein
VRRWTLDEATAALPEVTAIVRRIRELVAEAQEHAREHGGRGAAPVSGNGHGPKVQVDDRELRAYVTDLEQRGIIVRDPARGLIDFPATSPSGRTYLLCWLEGEESIDWWHWPEDGFAGRTPITEPPD